MRMRAIAPLLLLCIAARPEAQEVRAVYARNEGDDGAVLTVALSEKLKAPPVTVKESGRILLELPGVIVPRTPTLLTRAATALKEVRFSKSAPLRVVIVPREKRPCFVQSEVKGTFVSLRVRYEPVGAGPPATTERQVTDERVLGTRESLNTEQLFSLNATGLELGAVLQMLARQGNFNVALGEEGSRKVTVELRNLPLDETLKLILEPLGLAHKWEKNVLRVGEPNVLFPPPPKEEEPPKPAPKRVEQVYRTRAVSAAALAETLGKLYPGGEDLSITVAPEPSSPNLGSTGASGLGWGSGASSPGAQASEGAAKAMTRVLLFNGVEERVRAALETCEKLDALRPQVVVNVEVVDLSQTSSRELGITYSWNKQTLNENGAHDNIHFGTFVRDPAQVELTLSALAKSGNAKILANPSVAVLDGERGFILIGERSLYPVLIGYSQAQTPIFDKAEERVGIYLQVAPRIDVEGGEVTLTLYPQISTITGFLKVNEASYPQISTREAQSTIRVKDGQKIVIGGLLQEREIKDMQAVPGLSKIPLFGELFKSRINSRTKSEVLIFITPHIVREER
jgi:hypothetical protein